MQFPGAGSNLPGILAAGKRVAAGLTKLSVPWETVLDLVPWAIDSTFAARDQGEKIEITAKYALTLAENRLSGVASAAIDPPTTAAMKAGWMAAWAQVKDRVTETDARPIATVVRRFGLPWKATPDAIASGSTACFTALLRQRQRGEPIGNPVAYFRPIFEGACQEWAAKSARADHDRTMRAEDAFANGDRRET